MIGGNVAHDGDHADGAPAVVDGRGVDTQGPGDRAGQLEPPGEHLVVSCGSGQLVDHPPDQRAAVLPEQAGEVLVAVDSLTLLVAHEHALGDGVQGP